MTKIKNIIVALGVFTMMIGSGFAMDIHPPAEPVKGIVETEVVVEAPQQVLTPYTGDVGYIDPVTGDVIKLPSNPGHCTLVIFYPQCTIDVDTGDGIETVDLYAVIFNSLTNKWEITFILYMRFLPII